MGKNAQKRRGDTQPQIVHFTMSGESYVAIRRYLGSRPHDETRDLIMHLEQMPAITVEDIQLRDKQGARLAELEAADVDAEDLYPDGDPNSEEFPNEEIEELGLVTAPDPDATLATDTGEE